MSIRNRCLRRFPDDLDSKTFSCNIGDNRAPIICVLDIQHGFRRSKIIITCQHFLNRCQWGRRICISNAVIPCARIAGKIIIITATVQESTDLSERERERYGALTRAERSILRERNSKTKPDPTWRNKKENPTLLSSSLTPV